RRILTGVAPCGAPRARRRQLRRCCQAGRQSLRDDLFGDGPDTNVHCGAIRRPLSAPFCPGWLRCLRHRSMQPALFFLLLLSRLVGAQLRKVLATRNRVTEVHLDHQVAVTVIHASPPLAAHAMGKTARIPMLSVDHSDRIGAATAFGVPDIENAPAASSITT